MLNSFFKDVCSFSKIYLKITLKKKSYHCLSMKNFFQKMMVTVASVVKLFIRIQ